MEASFDCILFSLPKKETIELCPTLVILGTFMCIRDHLQDKFCNPMICIGERVEISPYGWVVATNR